MATFPTLQVLIQFSAPSSGTALIFNNSSLGKFDTATFGGSIISDGIYVDVSTDIRDITVTRGRQRQIEAFAAGTCTLTLDNNAGNYDPDNTASAYYPYVLPMRQVVVQATWNGTLYPLFTGFIDNIRPDYAQGKYSDAWTTIGCTDGMKVLQNIKLNNIAAPAETSDARANRILDAVGWPASLRQIDTSLITLQAVTLSNSAAQELQNTADSEYGRWYMTPGNVVRFEQRSARNAVQTSTTTWADTSTATNLVYSSVSRVIDDELVRNQITVTRTGGVAQSVQDSTSITNYQDRTFSTSNVLLQSDIDASELASIYLYQGKSTQARIEQVVFQPLGDPTNLWPEVLGRAISDRVNLTVTPPRVSPITVGGYVEGMTHTIGTAPQNWTTSFHASRSNPTNFLIFDDATYGVLESTSNGFGY